MALTNDDLQAIANLMDDKLNNVQTTLANMMDDKLNNVQTTLANLMDNKLDNAQTTLENLINDNSNLILGEMDRFEQRINNRFEKIDKDMQLIREDIHNMKNVLVS